MKDLHIDVIHIIIFFTHVKISYNIIHAESNYYLKTIIYMYLKKKELSKTPNEQRYSKMEAKYFNWLFQLVNDLNLFVSILRSNFGCLSPDRSGHITLAQNKIYTKNSNFYSMLHYFTWFVNKHLSEPTRHPQRRASLTAQVIVLCLYSSKANEELIAMEKRIGQTS